MSNTCYSPPLSYPVLLSEYTSEKQLKRISKSLKIVLCKHLDTMYYSIITYIEKKSKNEHKDD